jgi:hypothetical protein
LGYPPFCLEVKKNKAFIFLPYKKYAGKPSGGFVNHIKELIARRMGRKKIFPIADGNIFLLKGKYFPG